MCFRRIRRSIALKYFVAVLVAAVAYCEYFVYIKQSLFWQDLKCEEKSCMKILFIADPQIQGDLAVPAPLNYLFNWDSDRYLRSTFLVVQKHFKPDVLVFLGDLMDEGSIATKQQFHHYARRIMNIFETEQNIVHVWIPGDNDIGGENEAIKWDKVEEFENIFKQPSIVIAHNTIFYKVNAITNSIPKPLETTSKDKHYKIVVSHYPVTIRQHFAQKINEEIEPNIYFCAHTHESKYVKQYSNLTHRETFWMSRKEILTVPIYEENVYEIYVPTCSYRMGTRKIGYGAAVLDDYGKVLKYTVLWSPERFVYLLFYLVLLVIVLCYCTVHFTIRLWHFSQPWSAPSTRTMDKTPLLS